MLAKCPHCNHENKSDAGNLLRCDACQKVFEVGGDNPKNLAAIAAAKAAVKDETVKVAPDKKNCPYCAETIKAEAIKCKHCGEILARQQDSNDLEERQPQRISWIAIIGGGFIGLCVLALLFAPKNKKPSATLAYVICENIVESKLKSPSTAEFAGYGNSQITGADKAFVIKSYVDAQNSFGATARTKWSCSATYTGGDPYDNESWNINAFTHK